MGNKPDKEQKHSFVNSTGTDKIVSSKSQKLDGKVGQLQPDILEKIQQSLSKFQQDTGKALSQKEVGKAVRNISVLEFEEKTDIILKGDSPKGIFIITEGSVNIMSSDGDEILANLDTGAIFGEISVLYNVPCTARVQTATRCVLAHLDLNSAHHLLRKVNIDVIDWFINQKYLPTMESLDVKRTLRRMVFTSLRQVSMFEEWTEMALKGLILLFDPAMVILYQENSTILHVDDPPVRVYLIIRGSAVIKDANNKEIICIKVGKEPCVLGEEGIFLQYNSRISVQTTSCCEVIQINLGWIQNIINKYQQETGHAWETRKMKWKAHLDKKNKICLNYSTLLQFEVIFQSLRNCLLFSCCSSLCVEYITLQGSPQEYHMNETVCTQEECDNRIVVLVLSGQLEQTMESETGNDIIVPEGQVFLFAEAEVKTIANHYKKTIVKALPDFTIEETLNELRLFKKVIYKRHGSKLQELTWADIYDPEFPMLMAVIELLGCIPPTSVSCETTFSQMKLVKTSRRTRLQTSTLNDVLMVKLQSPEVTEYDPTSSIDKWLSLALKPRIPNYYRARKCIKQATIVIDSDATAEEHDAPGKCDWMKNFGTLTAKSKCLVVKMTFDIISDAVLRYKGSVLTFPRRQQ